MTKYIDSTGGPPKKNKTGLALLILMGVLSILFVLQQFGLKTIGRSERDAWVDHNSPEQQNRPMPKRRPALPDPAVEQTLNDIAEEFKGPVFSDIRTANSQKGWGLTNDEANFYDRMRAKYAGQATGDHGWLGLVKDSYATYQTVKQIFGGRTDAGAAIQDAPTAARIYQRLQQDFGISPTESRRFAPTGKTLGDWANFVEEQKKAVVR